VYRSFSATFVPVLFVRLFIMPRFGVTRASFGAAAFLLNSLWALFLAADFQLFSRDIHSTASHHPVVLVLLGTACLAVLFIGLIAFIDICWRKSPPGVTQVRVEVVWIALVIFLQYSAALIFTTLYIFSFECKSASVPSTCKILDLSILVGSWTIPFSALLYLWWFIHLVLQVSERDHFVWHTPIRSVAWTEGGADADSDAKSIASFANYESATMKAELRLPISRPVRDSRLKSMTSFYSTESVRRPPPASLQAQQPPSPKYTNVRYFQATAPS